MVGVQGSPEARDLVIGASPCICNVLLPSILNDTILDNFSPSLMIIE